MNEDMYNLAEIRVLLKSEKAEEAKRRFQAIEASDNVEYFLLKGELEQKYQNYGEAMNAFNKVLEIDPENAEAQNNLHLIQNILNFWNPDMFNP